MKVLTSLLFGIVVFVVYDYINYNKIQKENDIKTTANKINYHKLNFEFNSKDYKEFVYAK